LKLFRNGLADYSSKSYLYAHKNNKGGSTIQRLDSKNQDETKLDPRYKDGKRYELDLIRLDDVLPLIKSHDVHKRLKVVYWKADIEGYESRMFRGSTAFFAYFDPIPKVQFEIQAKTFNITKCNLKVLLTTFINMGYTIYWEHASLPSPPITLEVVQEWTPKIIANKWHADITISKT